MDIIGTFKITKDIAVPDCFPGGQVVVTDNTIEVEDRGNNAKITARSGTSVIFEGEIDYYGAGKDAIRGKLEYQGDFYHVSAYTRIFGDHCYIFGTAIKKVSSADSGGQWDGNRPR